MLDRASCLENIMINVGDILSTVRVFSTMGRGGGDILSTVGSYSEYRGGYSVP